jgi:hypothetical protein
LDASGAIWPLAKHIARQFAFADVVFASAEAGGLIVGRVEVEGVTDGHHG